MSREPAYLADILGAAKLIQAAIQGVSQEALAQDWIRLSAIERQIEIIGEATRRLCDSFKGAHPEIPWREMAGMRDVLIHAYDDLDLDDIWSYSAQRYSETRYID
jgi:uncharacterized protein with HEPN domain